MMDRHWTMDIIVVKEKRFAIAIEAKVSCVGLALKQHASICWH